MLTSLLEVQSLSSFCPMCEVRVQPGSKQTGQSLHQDVLVLGVHGLVGVQLQREGCVARRECSQDGGVALDTFQGKQVNDPYKLKLPTLNM